MFGTKVMEAVVVKDLRSLLGRVGVWSMELRDAGRPQVLVSRLISSFTLRSERATLTYDAVYWNGADW